MTIAIRRARSSPGTVAAMLALAVVLLVLAPARARADGRPMVPEARVHLDRGLQRFAARDYAGAIAAFDAGLAIDPHPDFLYARGQAQRLSGDCAAAVESYRGFLASTPPASEAELARLNLRRCEEQLEREAAAIRPRPPPSSQTRRSASRPPARRPWYRDLVGGTLVAGGAAGLAAGATFLVLADGRVDQANQAEDLGDYARERDRVSTRRTLGAICLAAGGALLAGGLVRYWLLPGNDGRVGIAAGVDAGVDAGAFFTLSGPF